MKNLALVFLFSLIAVGLCAQRSDRYLKKTQQQDYVLYFITPTNFKNKSDKLQIETDFTFQFSDATPTAVDMRFSLFSRTPASKLERLRFLAQGKQVAEVEVFELLFLQKEKKNWHSRFSVSIPYPALLQMLQAGSAAGMNIAYTGKEYTFVPDQKWNKAAAILSEILVVELTK